MTTLERPEEDPVRLLLELPRVGLDLLVGDPLRVDDDEGANDAEHNVSDHAIALIALYEEAGKIAGNRAEDDPRKDVHSLPPSQIDPPTWRDWTKVMRIHVAVWAVTFRIPNSGPILASG